MKFKLLVILMYLWSSPLFTTALMERLTNAHKKIQKLRKQIIINQLSNAPACATKCKVKCHQCKGSPHYKG